MTATSFAWLHGWAAHPSVWDPLIDLLPRESSHQRLGYPQDVAPTCDSLTTAPRPGSVLVGWSLGAMLALQYAQSCHDLAALVLIGGTLRFVDDGDGVSGWSPRIVRRMSLRLLADPDSVLRDFTAAMFSPAEAAEADRWREHFPGTDMTPEQLRTGLEALLMLDLRSAARQVTCPVLWLHGEEDSICPISGFNRWREQLAAASNHRFVTLPGAGHLPQWTQPGLVAAHLEAFLP